MIPGELVEIAGEHGPQLALVLGEEQKKVRLLTELGEQLLLPATQRWRSLGMVTTPPSDPALAQAELRRMAAEIRRLQEELDLRSLWEQLVDAGERRCSAGELAEQGLRENSCLTRAAIWRAVKADRLLFRIRKDQLEPTGRRTVEETLRQRALGEERARERQAGIAALRLALQLEQPVEPGEHEELLELLMALAVHGIEHPAAGPAAELLAALGVAGGREPQLKAFDLLVRLGRFQRNENLHLLRIPVPLAFDEPLRVAAGELALRRPWEEPGRVDLTSLYTVAIDDPETTEVDDALSIVDGPGAGWTVWVHIADPGAFVAPRSELLREAGRRAATLYLPDRKITMFPPALAEGPFSLEDGVDRAALSLRAELSPEGEVTSFAFLISRVRVDERISYEEADHLLYEQHGTCARLLGRLQEAADLLEARRKAHGAFVLNGPEVKIRVDDEGRIQLRQVERESPGRALVAEMMILVGCCAARLFLRHCIPAIYRVQEPPEEPLGPTEGTLDAASFYHMLRKLRRAELSRIPGRHAGLGVEPYVQITSPIRRYGDLLLQQQLKSLLLTGRPCYDEEELLDALGSAEATAACLVVVERETRRFWTLRYLEGRKGTRMSAMVLEERHPGHYLVELGDLCLRASLAAPQGLEPGSVVQVVLGTVDARRDRIHLRFDRFRQPEERGPQAASA